jgi:opacity protein-like surface antigen
MMHRWVVLVIVMLVGLANPQEIAADSRDPERGSEAAREFLHPEEPEADTPRLRFFDGRVTLAFLLELAYEYSDVEETDDEDSGSLHDIFLDTAEFALQVTPIEAIEARVVAGIENVHKNGDDTEGFLDEASLRLRYPGVPFYFVGGKRTQPFGVFEDRLISGTITEDLYEIVKVGATVGYAPEALGLDLAVTAYRGQEISQNLQSEDIHEFDEGRRDRQENGSYIASLQLEPWGEWLFLSASYNNEPGDGRRNQSLGGALTLTAWDCNLDFEYIAALSREDGENEEENLEKAWFVGLSWELREDFEVATRYEHLDDDDGEDQEEVVDYRWLAGFNYTFTDYTTLSVEYRYTNFEQESDSDAVGEQNELIIQLALEY